MQWKYHVLLYENGKMRPIATILGLWGEGDKGERCRG
jgi:hypothetical protein